MKLSFRHCVALSLLMGATTTFAQTDAITVDDPWIRGSAPGQKHGAGYVTIHNQTDQPTQLKAARSDRAQRIELHTIVREEGVAKMRQVPEIPVPSNGKVKLEPGGYHIMFIGLTEPFTPGESVPLVLEFDNQSPLSIDFQVQVPTHNPARHGVDSGHHHEHGKGH